MPLMEGELNIFMYLTFLRPRALRRDVEEVTVYWSLDGQSYVLFV